MFPFQQYSYLDSATPTRVLLIYGMNDSICKKWNKRVRTSSEFPTYLFSYRDSATPTVDMSEFVHRKLSMLAAKTERKKVDRLCGCCWRMDWRRWTGKSDHSSHNHGSEEVLQILPIPDLPSSIVASPLSTRPIMAWTLHPKAKRMR